MMFDPAVEMGFASGPPFALLCGLATGFVVSIAALVLGFASRVRGTGWRPPRHPGAGAAAPVGPLRWLALPGGTAVALFVWASWLFVESMIPSGRGLPIPVGAGFTAAARGEATGSHHADRTPLLALAGIPASLKLASPAIATEPGPGKRAERSRPRR